MRMLTGHSKGVRSVVYLPNGNLVSGSEDRTVRIWDGSTWEEIRTIKAKTPVYAMAVSPDGNTIAYAGKHPSNNPRVIWIQAYNIAEESSGTLGGFSREDYESVWRLTYSPDGEYLFAVGRLMSATLTSGVKAVFYRTSQSALGQNFAPELEVYTACFASDSRLGITARSKLLFFPTLNSTEPNVSYEIRNVWLGELIFLPNSPLVVVGGESRIFFVDATTNSTPIPIWTGFRMIYSLAVSPGGRWLFVGGKPNGVEIYDTVSQTLRTRYDFEIGRVNSVAVSPTGETFAIGGDEGLAVIDCDF